MRVLCWRSAALLQWRCGKCHALVLCRTLAITLCRTLALTLCRTLALALCRMLALALRSELVPFALAVLPWQLCRRSSCFADVATGVRRASLLRLNACARASLLVRLLAFAVLSSHLQLCLWMLVPCCIANGSRSRLLFARVHRWLLCFAVASCCLCSRCSHSCPVAVLQPRCS